MKKTLKKGLAYLLAVSMIITFIPMAAFGAETPAGAGSANDTVSLSATAEDGMTVFITAAPGVLPEGATVTASVVQDAQPVKELIGKQTDVGSMAAYDVTIRDPQGNEIQPDGTVGVTFRNANVAGDAKVFHVEGEAEAPKAATEMETILSSESLQSFTTDGFSIYVVVGEGEDARLLVNFMSGENEVAQMYVRKGDNMEQVVYDPGVGELDEGVYFRGWTTDENYTTKTIPMTIAEVRTDLAKQLPPEKDGNEVTYYAMLFKSYTITYYDEYGISLGQQEVSFRADSENTSQSYTVNMAYTVQDTEHNFEGWKVNKGGPNIAGWKQTDNDGQGTFYENDTLITISGDVEFGVNAPEGHWLVFNENGKGATYNAPDFIYTDTVTEKPCDDQAMTRYGYTFTGWYKDEACTEEFKFGDKISDYTTVYAGWKANESANYTVIIWKQRSSDAVDATNANKKYDFAEAITSTGTVGTAITGVTQNGSNVNTGTTPAQTRNIRVNNVEKAYTGFHCARYDQNVMITAEGTAVLNVYYDRNVITVSFDAGNNRYILDENDNTYKRNVTYTGLYEAPLTFSWPTRCFTNNSGAGGSNAMWHYGNTTLSFIGSFKLPTPTNTSLSLTRTSAGDYPVRFIQQATDGTWPTTAKDTAYFDSAPASELGFTISEKYTGFRAYQYRTNSNGIQATTGWTNWASALNGNGTLRTITDGRIDQIEIRFQRIQEPITYLNGVYFSGNSGEVVEESSHGELHQTDPIYYDADITDYGKKGNEKYYIPNAPAGYEDYVFEGWYADETCTTPYVWSTMPAEGVTVYAKWRQIQYRVFLHPNKPDGASGDIDWGEGVQLDFRVSSGGTISEPTGLLNGYEFVGWYKDEECTQAFNGNAYVLNETNVTTEYNSSQPDYQSTDADRFWITKRFDIYAKWRATLEGAQGIGISYDLNGGTGTAGDTNTYVDGAWAPAAAAVTAPEGKQFGYWVVQTWDDGTNAYVDDEDSITVFPGDTFQVLKKDAKIEDLSQPVGKDTKKYTVQLKAVYIDSEEPTPTFITWFNNDGTAGYTNEGVTSLAINEAVPIVDAPTRDGYTFLGWSIFREPLDYDDLQTREEALAAAVEWEADRSNWTQDLDENDLNVTYDLETKTYNAEKVAANEDTPYHAMFAVWEEDEVTINYAVASDSTDMGAVSCDSETIPAITGKASGSTATASDTYAFDYWTVDDETDPVSTEATFVPTKNSSGVYEAHTYYAHFKNATATVTVHHYLKGTSTKVADDDIITQQTIGSEYTAKPVEKYQEKDLTVDSYNPSQKVTVSADGNEITIYYTLPLTITVADRELAYTGVEQYGYGEKMDEVIDGEGQTTKSVTVTGLLDGDSVVNLNYNRANGTDVADTPYIGSFTADPTVSDGTVNVSYYIITKTAGKLTITKADGNTPEPTPGHGDTAEEQDATSKNITVVYDGKAHTVSGKASKDENSVITYSTTDPNGGGEATWTTAPTRTDVGSTEFWIKAESDNYEDAIAGPYTLTVTPKEITVNGTKTESYDGTKKTLDLSMASAGNTSAGANPSIAGLVDGETLTLTNAVIEAIAIGTYEKSSDAEESTKKLDGFTWSVSKTVGETVEESTGNYTIKVSGTLTIEKGDGNTPEPTPGPGDTAEEQDATSKNITVVYDGKEHTVSGKASKDENSVITYSTTDPSGEGEVTWTTAPTRTEVGSTQFWIKAESDNYEDAIAGPYTLEVTKRPVTITVANSSKTEGQADPAFADATMEGQVEGQLTDISLAVTRSNFSVNTAGTYAGVLNISSTKEALETEYTNYTFTINPGTFTINSSGGGGGPTPRPIDPEPVPLDLATDHYAYVEGYEDGTVKPDGSITRAETATMIYRLLTIDRRDEVFTDQNDYSDVDVAKWYNKAVSSMTNGEYVNGYPDGTFKANRTITRAEFVTILVRFLEGQRNGENPFSDVSGHWAEDYIVTAVQAGWIDGYPDGTFKPNEPISRAEAMKIMNSVLHRGVNEESELGDYINFPDNSDPSKWYYFEIIEAVNSHEAENERPDENWIANECEFHYDIDKYERPGV